MRSLSQETVQRMESVEDCISLVNRDFARGGLAHETLQQLESIEDGISLANRDFARGGLTRPLTRWGPAKQQRSVLGVFWGYNQPCRKESSS